MQVRRTSQFGIGAAVDSVHWSAIRDRIMARIKETSETGCKNRIESAHVTLFEGHTRFSGPHELVINDDVRIEADQIVVAAGGRPSVPEVVTNSGTDYHTSDTIMWLDALPASMVILGGGYVAAEFAHVFSSLGVEIHIVTVASTLLESLDTEISKRFTAKVADRWNIRLNSFATRVDASRGGVIVDLNDGTRVSGELLLVATGRQPNTEDLGLGAARIALRDDGHIVVDEFGLATAGVWALGDVSSPFELKHVANAEARTIAYNLSHPEDPRPLPHDWVRPPYSATPRSPQSGHAPKISKAASTWKQLRNTATLLMGGPSRIMMASASSTPIQLRAPFSVPISLATKPHSSSRRWSRRWHMANGSRILPAANIGSILR